MHQRQHLGCRAFDFGRHIQQGRGHVGDFRLAGHQAQARAGIHGARRGIAQLHAQSVKDQSACQRVQAGPRQAFGRQHGLRQIIQFKAAKLAGKSEFTVFGVGKRPSRQITFDLNLYIRIDPFDHRITHILAHAGGQRQGQVTVGTRCIDLLDLTLQIQHARAAAVC